MKALRGMAVVLAVAVAVALAAGASFAEKGMMCKDMKEACQAKIKALKDSAAALQGTNPDLAKGLTDIAVKKEKMIKDMEESKMQGEAKVKLLRDSAAALQKTNPEMAEELWEMSEFGHMKKGSSCSGCSCPGCPCRGMGGDKHSMMRHEGMEGSKMAGE